MIYNNYIPADVEISHLHLRTNSAEGSNEYVLMAYYDEKRRNAGALVIWFGAPLEYLLVYCQSQDLMQPFPTSPPVKQDKHWVIEKRGNRTTVYCNGEKVLDIAVSSETCDDPEEVDTWATYWGREASQISFIKSGTAIDSYHIGQLVYFAGIYWIIHEHNFSFW